MHGYHLNTLYVDIKPNPNKAKMLVSFNLNTLYVDIKP